MQRVVSAPAVSEVRWQPCFRVIPSRYPTIDLFERVADPADWEALYWIESLTNPRLRDEIGDIELVPREERAFGPGGSVIMAPFTHLDPSGSRFADGTFGAFYAAAELATSVAETCHHREVFLRATREEPLELDMRSYLADVAAGFHDIRGKREQLPDIYDPDSYVASKAFGRELKLSGSNGLVYDSVRHSGGHCLAVYRPRLIQNLRQGVHLRYVWDGERIARVFEIRAVDY
jgi:hypothetical protein